MSTSPALAHNAYVSSGSFGSASSGVVNPYPLANPQGVAVDQASHEVYVADSTNARIEKFDSSGNFLAAWGWGVADGQAQSEVCTAGCQPGNAGSGAGQFSDPVAVAVDNSGGPATGTVYVADSTNNVVEEFSSSGGYLATISGPDAGPFLGVLGVATDSAGDLWTYDANATVGEFDSTGATLQAWNTNYGTSPPFTVDANGDVYAARGCGCTEKFTGAGADMGELDPNHENATALGADLANGLVFDAQSSYVAVYDASAVPPAAPLSTFGSFSNATGVADDFATGTAYVADASTGEVDVFTATPVPDATTGTATNESAHGATLNGTVTLDNASLTDCHFEYVDDADYAPSAGDPYAAGQTAPCAQTPSGNAPVPVSADVTGLSAPIEYHFRLVAGGAGGSSYGSDVTFETPAVPAIEREFVTDVSADAATLHAQINPDFATTTYHFEYVAAQSYASSGFANAARGPATDALAGSGGSTLSVVTNVEALAAGTSYRYRVVATNSQGPSAGPTRSFTTEPSAGGTAALPDGRAYELVSPRDKNGGSVADSFQHSSTESSVDGSRVTYSSPEAFADAQAGAAVAQFYLGTRGIDGWSAHSLLPPQAPNCFSCVPEMPLWSSDLSKATLLDGGGNGQDDPALVAGEPADSANVFLRDNSNDSYQLINTAPAGTTLLNADAIAASPDLRHVVFLSSSGVAQGNVSLWDWSGGTARLVGVAPDGSPFDDSFGPNLNARLSGDPAPHMVSDDGRRIFFRATQNGSAQPNLYVREDGVRTVQVDRSQAGGPGGNGWFQAASADGSRVLFSDDAAAGLTTDTVAGSGINLYEYDVDSGALTDLTPGSDAGLRGLVGTSSDLADIYFVADSVLATGAAAGEPNLYLMHAGTTRFITTLDPSDSEDWSQVLGSDPYGASASRVTPDGHVLAFQSVAPLTGYDNALASGDSCGVDQWTDQPLGRACTQLYRFSADNGQLTCVSCNPSGAAPLGRAYIGDPLGHQNDQSDHLTRNLSDDGTRLFFDSEDALVPADTNGQRDVYEWEQGGAGGCQESGGCVYLISSGKSADNSTFEDASTSGNDVFFTTLEQLAPADGDVQSDLYDARVAGGFSANPANTPCSGDACKPAPSAGPAAPLAATETTIPTDSRPKGSAAAGRQPTIVTRHARGHTSFRIRLNVPAPGRVRIYGMSIHSVSRHFGQRGRYSMALHLTKKEQLALKRRGKLVVRLYTSYTPAVGGRRSTVATSISVVA